MRKPLSLAMVLIAMAVFVAAAWRDGLVLAQPARKAGGIAASYDTHCAKCHGKDGKGIESLQPPDFTDTNWQSSQTDKMISDGIRNGKGVMPGFKDALKPAEVTAMVKYVRAFSPKTAKKK